MEVTKYCDCRVCSLGKWLDTIEKCVASTGGDGPFSFGSKPVWVDYLVTDASGSLAFFFGQPYADLLQVGRQEARTFPRQSKGRRAS